MRTTGRCTWLVGGTSMTASPTRRAVQPSRFPGASGRARRASRSVAPAGVERVGGRVDAPTSRTCPVVGRTWQCPQIARPPHTESTSTPSVRAASRTVVPEATRPSSPAGRNTTRQALTARSRRCGRARPVVPSGTRRRSGRRLRPRRPAARRRSVGPVWDSRGAPPLRHVVGGLGQSRRRRRLVDRTLEAPGEDRPVPRAARLRVHLGRDVAPPDRHELRGHVTRRRRGSRRLNGARPTGRCTNRSPRTSAAWCPRSTRTGSSVCDSSTSRR